MIASVLLLAPATVVAQHSTGEHEVRAFLAAYDSAVVRRDVDFLARALPDDYVMTGTNGRKSTRAQVLAFFTRERDTPSSRLVSLKHEQVVVRVVGDMAVVTNTYSSQTTPIAAPQAEPDVYEGRHTAVLEKRNGRWLLIAEQDTEQVHDDKHMERQVAMAGRDHVSLRQRLRSGRSDAELETSGDLAAFTRQFADGYVATGDDGVVIDKARALARDNPDALRITTAELREQSVRAIDNNAVIETGIVRYAGTKAGQPFASTQRYTNTWVNWGRGWQIVAHHASVATP